ncbi:MAG: response regulator transcription factor [Anaerolineae bacterium]|nr:response regulator transcription factor [Anaerolineae bacterium]
MTSSKPIRLIIADDHSVVRSGLQFLMLTEPGIEIVGETDNGATAVQLAQELQPDVILLDLQMPQMGGIEAIGVIKQFNPNAHILVLTSFADDDHVFAAIKAGALGYLLKDSAPPELIQAIYDVNAGESSLHPKIARKLIQELNKPTKLPPTEEPLTEREMEVLKLLAQGLSNQDIADLLVVTERTVRAHVSSILAKLHLANRTQAALYALRKGLAELEHEG